MSMQRQSKPKERAPLAVAPRRRSRHLEGVTEIQVRDYEMLRHFVTEYGKIMPARLTGASAKQQRQVRRGIRRARQMGIMA